ncbi:protein NinF [Pantoea trifolii]|uniref:protein NinF n=1 Tax=Candidatus Pantoea symbiotica TaxID=1884370 RepID=UPI003D688895
MQNTSNTSHSTQSGDTHDIRCAGCDAPLPPDWVYACDRCCAGWMQDDNFRMHGESDEESQKAM